MCAISAMPMLQIEVAKEARQGAAATESFRNEMVRAQGEFLPPVQQVQITGRTS
jgi:hypothetical protein